MNDSDWHYGDVLRSRRTADGNQALLMFNQWVTVMSFEAMVLVETGGKYPYRHVVTEGWNCDYWEKIDADPNT